MGRLALICGLVLVASVSQGGACTIVESRSGPITALNDAMHYVFENKRVRQNADCSFVNGSDDDLSSGAAVVDQGKGRISQIVSRFSPVAMVLDCNAMEVVKVIGKTIPGTETDCGAEYTLLDLIGPQGSLDLGFGKDIDAFVKYATQNQIRVSDKFPIEELTGTGKDRVDIFCGCKLYYPESRGGKF